MKLIPKFLELSKYLACKPFPISKISILLLKVQGFSGQKPHNFIGPSYNNDRSWHISTLGQICLKMVTDGRNKITRHLAIKNV